MKIYLSSKIRPDRDNATAINRVLEMAKEGSIIDFPDGVFPVGATLVQSKKLHWEGGETELKATKPITLVNFIRAHKSIISKINFVGGYSIWDKNNGDTFNAVEIRSIVNMRDCMVRNAWGDGVHVSADISHSGTNASQSRFDNIEIGQCKGNGIYFRGGDANCCGVYNVDIRDCNGIGFYDHSFLGNQFYNCMTHSNKGGSFKADDPNNRAGFYGCYCEHDQPPVHLEGAACWFGGLPSRGIILRGFAKMFTYDSVENIK